MGGLYDTATLHAPVLTCTHAQSKHYVATGYADLAQLFRSASMSVGSKMALAGRQPAIFVSED